MNQLRILVGNIASGKSSYCKQYHRDDIIVNDDAIVNAIHNGQNTGYDKQLKPLYKMIENTIVYMGLAMGKTVVIDRPNVKASTRQRYISIAKSLDIPVVVAVMPRFDPAFHAQRRFDNDDRGYSLEKWVKAATRYHLDYESPTMDEGISEIIYLQYSSTERKFVKL